MDLWTGLASSIRGIACASPNPLSGGTEEGSCGGNKSLNFLSTSLSTGYTEEIASKMC